MKKILPALTAILLSVFSFGHTYGQSAFSLPRAYAYLADRYGLDHATVGDLKVLNRHYDDHNQVEHIYLTQTINGHEVYGSSINLVLEKNGNLSSVGHRLIELNKITYAKDRVAITATDAIKIVAGNFGSDSRSIPTLKKTLDSGTEMYDKADLSLLDIPVDLVYYPSSTNTYVLSWQMQYQSPKNGILYQSYVNASSGEIIKSDVLTIRCSFDYNYLLRPYDECDDVTASAPNMDAAPVNFGTATYRALMLNAESPNHGTFELLNGVEDPQASPFGWHDTNGAAGAEFTITRGNNVHAFLDRNWDYASDRDVNGGAGLTFDFPFNPDLEPSGNQDVAVTNLFVRNNFMHDFAFRYGFNEDYNFQQTNYSGAGIGTDYVHALAQFGDNSIDSCGADVNGGTACINNADFSTPSDGLNGQMRMFTWNQDNSSKLLDILQPQELAGKITTGAAQFGLDITTTPVTGEVVIVDDGTSDGSKGCQPIVEQDLTGKIALIDRGLCDFSLKVYDAQNAGAVGAIICNFEDAIIQMAAGDNAADITIPSVFITHSECNRIRIAAGQGLVASLVAPVLTGAAERDGALDNGVVSHEYGHGISNRLLPQTNCLGNQEQMGEGWSDFMALITTVHAGDTGTKSRGIGTYAIKENTTGTGIRTYPYTTDMNVNPHTYDAIITEAEAHGIGSVWCAMLWDMYWAFADAYGLDLDPINGHGGNNMAIQLVFDGMKLTPCNPSFTDARDAILKADSIDNGGANSCMIWKVFARRGLGVNAVANDPNSWSDGKEGFDVPKVCLDEVRFTKTMTPEIAAGDNITVTLKVTNFKDFPLTNVAIEDQIPAGTSYLAGSANITPIVGNSLVWSIPSIAPDEEVLITYGLSTPSNKNSIRLMYDDMENAPEDRWDVYYDPNGNIDNFWFPEDVIVHSGVSAWGVGDPALASQHYLENFNAFTVSGNYPVYRFYHYYNTEVSADGGFLEISTNDGDSWESLDSYMFRNRYPRKIQYATFVIPNLYAFSGLSSPDLTMTPVYIDLSAYSGQDVKIRYRFGTDDNAGGVGWYVDDVELMDAIIYNSQACLTDDELDPVCTEAPERGTIVDSQIINGVDDNNTAYPFTLLPNPAGDFVQVAMTAESSEKAEVRIFSMTGQLISVNPWNIVQGANQNTFDISRFAPGMYVLQVKSGKGMRSERFVKS